ncbi:hypothetical protein [Nonomuraea gerenzanensis]|uniref:Uncharacterized protein n=1 Tax=Nonomuraea gerenzanensis TaxID=93944 RepID=A0A1M4EIC6_9ACTN|nr:hypothetical protein [Nonomuraea gerenzanensis]UBU10268.1 hypothetical protein LCN96_38785 [Nonomuraea gerenzanensis]SBO98649.1 hypothetical protein BN4615_P8165 [Nonomuraea gerenzanensis]
MLDKLIDRLIPTVKADAACTPRCTVVSGPVNGCYRMRCVNGDCTVNTVTVCE